MEASAINAGGRRGERGTDAPPQRQLAERYRALRGQGASHAQAVGRVAAELGVAFDTVHHRMQGDLGRA